MVFRCKEHIEYSLFKDWCGEVWQNKQLWIMKMRSSRCVECAEFGVFSWVAEKLVKIEEKIWKKMNITMCRVIRSYLSQELKYDVMNETSAKKIWETLASKYLTKSVENRLNLKRRLHHFQLKREFLLVVTSTTTWSFPSEWGCSDRWWRQSLDIVEFSFRWGIWDHCTHLDKWENIT